MSSITPPLVCITIKQSLLRANCEGQCPVAEACRVLDGPLSTCTRVNTYRELPFFNVDKTPRAPAIPPHLRARPLLQRVWIL